MKKSDIEINSRELNKILKGNYFSKALGMKARELKGRLSPYAETGSISKGLSFDASRAQEEIEIKALKGDYTMDYLNERFSI